MNQLELSVKLKLAAEQFVKEATRASTEFKQAMSGIEQTAGKAGNGVESGFGKTRQGLVSISQQLQQTKNELIAFFSLRYGAELALSIIKTADAVAGLQSRLKLATTSAAEYATAQNQLFDISQRTATSMESSVVLYGRIAASMRDMGLAQTDTLAFTEAVAQTMRISGASAATAEAGITQLAQAMASGVLRGDEFNSVMENSPRLSQALADGLGEPIGALRAMAEAGELTAEKVTNALLSQKDVLASEYASMGLTVSAAMAQLSNAWQQYIGEADQAGGATKSLSAVISDIAKNFNDYANTVITVGKDALVIWAGFAAIKLGAAVAEFAALAREARAAGTAVKAIPGSVKIALLFVGFEALKIAGTWLGEFIAKLAHGEIASEKFAAGSKVALEVAAHATRVARDEAAKLAAEIERTNQLTAFEHFGESAESARQKIEIAAAGMVAAFAQTYAKAQDVGKALDALFKDVSFSSPASLDAMQRALDVLAETAYATGEQIQEGIGRALDKLSTEDLRKFQIAAEAAFGGAAGSAETLAAMLDASLGSAFRRLGGDLEKFRTGLDQVTRDAIEAFSAVAENARASGAEIGEAFKLALKTADTRQEVDALGAALKNAAADGVVAGKALEDAQTRLAAKVRETAGEVEGALGDAFKRAGIKSKAELNAIAEQAKADFKAIKQSGQATAEGIATAEKKYQDAEKAAKGVKEETKAIADEAGHAAGKTGEMADAATEVQASMNDAGSAAGSAVAFINDYMDGAKALYQQLGLTKQAIDDIFLRSIDRSMSWERAFKNAIEIYEQAVAAVERQKKSLSDAAAETQRLGAYADDVTRNFNATVQAANDLALGMDNAASAGASMQAGSTDPKINEALQQQWAAAEKLAQAYASIERSARSAAKSAEDAVRGFVSSSRSIHEELLTAQGKEDEAAASRFAARRADLEMSYKQLQVQIMIAEVQAKAAGIDTAELSQAKSDAAAAFNQAKNDLAQLEKIDAERRKKAKQDAANDARDAAAKAAAEKASADAAARQQMTNQAIPQTNNSAYGSAQAAASAAASSARSTGTASNTNNFYISGFTGSEDDVRRKIVPVLDKINYGSR